MAALTDYLPIEEIKKLYPSHFLLLSPVKSNSRGEILFGTVVLAAEKRSDLRFDMDALGLSHAAIVCTKKPDSNRCKWVGFFAMQGGCCAKA